VPTERTFCACLQELRGNSEVLEGKSCPLTGLDKILPPWELACSPQKIFEKLTDKSCILMIADLRINHVYTQSFSAYKRPLTVTHGNNNIRLMIKLDKTRETLKGIEGIGYLLHTQFQQYMPIAHTRGIVYIQNEVIVSLLQRSLVQLKSPTAFWAKIPNAA
jgi:hypothetical protein